MIVDEDPVGNWTEFSNLIERQSKKRWIYRGVRKSRAHADMSMVWIYPVTLAKNNGNCGSSSVRRVQNLNGSRMILNFTGAWLSPRSTILETTWRFRHPSVSFVSLKVPRGDISRVIRGDIPKCPPRGTIQRRRFRVQGSIALKKYLRNAGTGSMYEFWQGRACP
jgi:hypothetical protein